VGRGEVTARSLLLESVAVEAILSTFAVAVAQLVEHWIVAPVVAGSNPVGHPKIQIKMA
jgi:hypothetical protein